MTCHFWRKTICKNTVVATKAKAMKKAAIAAWVNPNQASKKAACKDAAKWTNKMNLFFYQSGFYGKSN